MKRNDLMEALSLVKPALANNAVIEQATSFAFIDGHVVTYNDEISIKHPVPEIEFTGAIKADELYQLLNKIKKDDITLEIEDNQLVISAGKAKAGFVLENEITLPLEEVVNIGKWKKLPPIFLEQLKFASAATTTDMSRAMLTCVHIQKNGHVEGSDGFRIAVHAGDESEVVFAQNILLPSNLVDLLVKYEPSKMALSKDADSGWVHFKTEQGTVISCRTFPGQYPNVSPHLKMGDGVEVTFPKNMEDLVSRAGVFSKRDNTMDEAVTIEISKNKLVISAESTIGGWFKEESKLEYDGPQMSFNITPVLFLSILPKLKTCTVSAKKVLFDGGNWKYLTLLR